MATVSTLKHHGIFEIGSLLGKYCLSAIKGGVYIMGGIGGFIIVLALLFPIFLVVTFLMKLVGLY